MCLLIGGLQLNELYQPVDRNTMRRALHYDNDILIAESDGRAGRGEKYSPAGHSHSSSDWVTNEWS
jgi:hypothetical protein